MPDKKKSKVIGRYQSDRTEIPFQIAMRLSLKSALLLLDEKNIDLDAIAKKIPSIQISPLGAINSKYNNIIKKLVERGIDPNLNFKLGNENYQFLYIAISSALYSDDHTLDLIQFLLEKGATVSNATIGWVEYVEHEAGNVGIGAEILKLLKEHSNKEH